MNADTRRRLSLLIPRLASDADGEVIATVRAIRRVLESGGADLHDMAKLVTAEPTIVYQTVYRDPPRQEPPRQEPPRRPPSGDDIDWAAKAAYCAERAEWLSEREAAFARDMVEKLKRWGEPTEKQAGWLDAIFNRLRRADRARA